MHDQSLNERVGLFLWNSLSGSDGDLCTSQLPITILWLSSKMKNNLIDSSDLLVSEKEKKIPAASLTVHRDINFKKTTSKECKHTAWPRAVSFLLFFEEIANPISILQIKVFYGSKSLSFKWGLSTITGNTASYVCAHSVPLLPLVSRVKKQNENYLILSLTFLVISKWRLNKVKHQWNKCLRFGWKSPTQDKKRAVSG